MYCTHCNQVHYNHDSTFHYTALKTLAKEAIQNNRIFVIYGGSCYDALRNALTARRWVEQIPQTCLKHNTINSLIYNGQCSIDGELERILLSNFVEDCKPKFIWKTFNEDVSKYYENNVLFSKLKLDTLWTTKTGLCMTMKRNYWHHIDNVAEVTAPRTYACDNIQEAKDFLKDYRMTACTSLLKWVLSMVANDRPVFNKTGKVSISIIKFALNRCEEYLLIKQHKDIDYEIPTAYTDQWNVFLNVYYKIITRKDFFEKDKEELFQEYLRYAKYFLKEIHKYRPQLSCEGCHNIWILKPDQSSRGRGIKIASKLRHIAEFMENSNCKCVVQKYIEEPLLIYDTKFDIRQYYLVTSTAPLVIWMYNDCYLKFSSQTYCLHDYHESIHLTNNAVQRNYKNSRERNYKLPTDNMWDLKTYKCYLDRRGPPNLWENIIYPGMKKSIIGVMLSCQESVIYNKNRFELFGCDFILDKEYKPWLIEINASPDLKGTTRVTAKICPEVLSDLVKVVIDHSSNPKASTGNFQCVFRQPTTISRYLSKDLEVRGYQLPLTYFYRGEINMVESFGEFNKNNTLLTNKSIKDSYDLDIMISPDEDSDTDTPKEEETCTYVTESTEELLEDASFLSSQLEEILRKVSSIIAKTSTQLLCNTQVSSPPRSPETRSLTQIKKRNHIYRTASYNT